MEIKFYKDLSDELILMARTIEIAENYISPISQGDKILGMKDDILLKTRQMEALGRKVKVLTSNHIYNSNYRDKVLDYINYFKTYVVHRLPRYSKILGRTYNSDDGHYPNLDSFCIKYTIRLYNTKTRKPVKSMTLLLITRQLDGYVTDMRNVLKYGGYEKYCSGDVIKSYIELVDSVMEDVIENCMYDINSDDRVIKTKNFISELLKSIEENEK